MLRLPPELVRRMDAGGGGVTVAVVRLGAMGDVLRALPAVRALRRRLPAARLFWIVDSGWAVLLEGHPDLTGVVPLPRPAWRAAMRSPQRWTWLARELRAFRRRLRSLSCDLALDLHGTARSGIVTAATGAPVRVGFAGHQQKEGNWLFTTHRVPSGARRTSRVERAASLVRALGVPETPLPGAGLVVAPEAERAAARVARAAGVGSGPYAVLNPGASRRQAHKRPPPALLAAAARRLDARGVVPLVVHGPGEREAADAVVAASGGTARPTDPLDLTGLAALLRRARTFVGGDSGPLHLACAVGCPVIGLYGPTDPLVNAPWGAPHVVVAPPGRRYEGITRRDRVAGGFDGIEPAHVEAAVERLLG